MADTVAAVIEQEVNGVENMIYMYSQSTSDGAMTLTVTFDIGTDIDKAQVLVQNRVASAEPRLPEEVRRSGVTVRKNNPDLLLVVHMVSPDRTYDQLYISNYALLNVRDVLARIEGAGSVNLFGAREYSMRVWLDPERIAALNMTAEEVVSALRQQNVQVAGGMIAEPPMRQTGAFQVPLQFKGRLRDASEFEDIIIKSGRDGRVVLLKDVARVELGALNYATYGYQNGVPAIVVAVTQAPGLRRAEDGQRHQGCHGRDLASRSRAASSIASSTTRPSSSRSRSESSTRPFSKPSPWWSSSSCFSCRPGGRRSFRSSPFPSPSSAPAP